MHNFKIPLTQSSTKEPRQVDCHFLWEEIAIEEMKSYGTSEDQVTIQCIKTSQEWKLDILRKNCEVEVHPVLDIWPLFYHYIYLFMSSKDQVFWFKFFPWCKQWNSYNCWFLLKRVIQLPYKISWQWSWKVGFENGSWRSSSSKSVAINVEGDSLCMIKWKSGRWCKPPWRLTDIEEEILDWTK